MRSIKDRLDIFNEQDDTFYTDDDFIVVDSEKEIEDVSPIDVEKWRENNNRDIMVFNCGYRHVTEDQMRMISGEIFRLYDDDPVPLSFNLKRNVTHNVPTRNVELVSHFVSGIDPTNHLPHIDHYMDIVIKLAEDNGIALAEDLSRFMIDALNNISRYHFNLTGKNRLVITRPTSNFSFTKEFISSAKDFVDLLIEREFKHEEIIRNFCQELYWAIGTVKLTEYDTEKGDPTLVTEVSINKTENVIFLPFTVNQLGLHGESKTGNIFHEDVPVLWENIRYFYDDNLTNLILTNDHNLVHCYKMPCNNDKPERFWLYPVEYF
jgi:hypothetical protein